MTDEERDRWMDGAEAALALGGRDALVDFMALAPVGIQVACPDCGGHGEYFGLSIGWDGEPVEHGGPCDRCDAGAITKDVAISEQFRRQQLDRPEPPPVKNDLPF
mgnify:CR=1 FL=1